jgi:hypothetical protein
MIYVSVLFADDARELLGDVPYKVGSTVPPEPAPPGTLWFDTAGSETYVRIASKWVKVKM